jgi:hypothetical protein
MRTLISLLFLCALGVAAAAQPSQKELAALVKAAKAQLVANLKDPSSVQYRGLYVARAEESGDLVLCGEFNARNSYGGFAGFEPFIASRDKLLYTGGILYGQFCGDKVAPVK